MMLTSSARVLRSAVSCRSSVVRCGSTLPSKGYTFASGRASNPVLASSSKLQLVAAAVGGAIGCTLAVAFSSSSRAAADDAKGGLDPNKFQKFKLSSVIPVNHNTRIYRFDLGSPDQKLELPIASFVLTKAPFNDKDGKPVIRPYTPISESSATGHFDLLVKSYPNGVVSKHFGALKPGDEVEFKGPIRKLTYEANMKKKIAMIAGGTGITPMLQVAREVLNNPADKTQLTLIFANIAEQDILLRKEFDDLAKKHSNFKVHYLLENPPPGWTQSVGRVSLDLIKQRLPPPSDDVLVFVCGPPPMVAAISGPKAPDFTQGDLSGFLKEAGYNKDQVFKF